MPLTLTLLLDLAGTLVFALSGALLAVRKGLDIVGVVVLSVAAGLGGGLIRDVLLGATPPAALRNEAYLLTALVAAALGFWFHPGFARLARLNAGIRLLDAAGLGFFAIAGTLKSVNAGLDPVPAVMLGVVTGVGGGVVRDVLAGDVPLVLRQEIYALAALLGAVLFVLADRAGLARSSAAALGVAVTVLVRLLALRFDLQAPRPRR